MHLNIVHNARISTSYPGPRRISSRTPYRNPWLHLDTFDRTECGDRYKRILATPMQDMEQISPFRQLLILPLISAHPQFYFRILAGTCGWLPSNGIRWSLVGTCGWPLFDGTCRFLTGTCGWLLPDSISWFLAFIFSAIGTEASQKRSLTVLYQPAAGHERSNASLLYSDLLQACHSDRRS